MTQCLDYFPQKILSIELCKALWCLLNLFPTTFLQAKEVAWLPDYNTNAPIMHFHVIFELSQLFEAPWHTTKVPSGQFENISSTQFRVILEFLFIITSSSSLAQQEQKQTG